jgi:hypothetical protein
MEVFENVTLGIPVAPIVGEAVAGEAAATLAEIKKLVKGLSVNTFDLAEKLHKVKKNKFYAPKYNTFGEYAKTLDLKLSKSYYLVKLVEIMESAYVPRSVYEPVGIAKLRIISRLATHNPDGTPKIYSGMVNDGTNCTGVELVKAIMENATTGTPEQIEALVRKANGQVGDNAPEWENIPMTAGQRAKWQEAISLAKKNIGSVGKDEDGQYKDASVGACAEVIAVSYLQDPNNYPEGYEIPTSDSDAVIDGSGSE